MNTTSILANHPNTLKADTMALLFAKKREIAVRKAMLALIIGIIVLSGTLAQAALPSTPLDLNTATLSELMQLPHVGPQRAQAIVEFRSKRAFQRSADLMRIKGMGRRTYLPMKPYVTVLPEQTKPSAPLSTTSKSTLSPAS